MKEFTEDEYQQMDKYLHHQLPQAEQQAFELRLQAEPALADELAWLKKMEANYRYIKLKEHFEDIHQKLDQERALDRGAAVQTFWQSWRRTLSLAASVVLVMGVGWWLWKNNQAAPRPMAQNKPPVVEQPKENFPTVEAPTMDVVALASGYAKQLPKDEAPVPAQLQKAVNSYRNNQPDAAIAALQKMPDTADNPTPDEGLYGSSKDAKPNNPTAIDPQNGQYRYFYLGLSYLKKGDGQRALAALKKVKNATLKPSTEWYEALALITLEQNNAAKIRLDKISKDPNHPYQIEATEVYDAMIR